MDPFSWMLFHGMLENMISKSDEETERHDAEVEEKSDRLSEVQDALAECGGSARPIEPDAHITVRKDEGLIAVTGTDQTPKMTWTLGERTVTIIVADTVVREVEFDCRIEDVTKEQQNNVTTYHIHPR